VKRLLLLAAVAAALVLGSAAPAMAHVEDFEFTSFDGEYVLTRDDDGRSLLTTTETLVAVFPDDDQNQGISRALVDNFDGHPVDLEILSVTDENGEPRAYEAEAEDEFFVLTIRDEGTYVHGEQTYVITYRQHNVTRYFDDTGVEEFYWDTNGTGWEQPFGTVTARVLFTEDILGTQAAGYAGAEGSDTAVAATPIAGGYLFEADDLGPGENLTVAVGFEPGTFVPRASGFFDSPFPTISLVGGIGSVIVAGLAGFARRTRLADAPGRGTIIAEYLPPKEATLPMSALLSGTVGKSTPAHIVKLAVAGNLRIVEVDGKKTSYRLEFVTESGADVDDLTFLHALFGRELTPGEGRSLEKTDEGAAKRITKLQSAVAKRSVTEGYRRTSQASITGWLFVASLVFAVPGVIFAVLSLANDFGGVAPALLLIPAFGGLIATFVLIARTPLEARGVELRDYLKGLKLYISLAEADRLKFLQSPEGALREKIAADDTAQLVKLNERLLPYAILFGLEKEWTTQLGRYYEELGEQPTWYAGSTAFNAAVFASSLSTLSSSASSAYTGSSSTGGSSGGGFSGGGGGGGGGGGV
jgi:uncharacterized membrane protein YgcG